MWSRKIVSGDEKCLTPKDVFTSLLSRLMEKRMPRDRFRSSGLQGGRLVGWVVNMQVLVQQFDALLSAGFFRWFWGKHPICAFYLVR